MAINVPEEFLWCRDFLHAWDPYDFHVSRNAVTRRNEMNEVVRCARCGTIKTRIMTTSGEILRNSYQYPDGYQLKQQGLMTPADRNQIRRMNYQKAMNEARNEAER
jgi:hypothetical protein